MATIDRAIMIASIAHAGQKDKAGKPYILHPLRVMLTVASDKNATDEQKIVAVLHDVIEDTYVQEQQLRENGFSEDIINAIKSVTKIEGESRMDAAKRTKLNAIGRVVKLADLKDNMDLSRIANPTAKDLLRVAEYEKVQKFLKSE
ncbi:MAG: HD domain-containing protein [Planctomycetia bacterium]|nr:HD domain-containing protein [Planctomycetia bacterium]